MDAARPVTLPRDRLERKGQVDIGQIKPERFAQDIAVFVRRREGTPLDLAIGVSHVEPCVE
jgi:hypothetical protein